MDFVNVTGDANSAWLSAGIAETVTGDLRAMDRFRVVDRGRVMEAIRGTDGSVHQVAARLGATFAVVGSYQTNADRIRITARIVNVESGEARADAKVDGPIAAIFELQDQVVAQFSKELGLGAAPASRDGAARETPSLEAYRAYTEAWLHLEALDVREIPAGDRRFPARDHDRSGIRPCVHRSRKRAAGRLRSDAGGYYAGEPATERRARACTPRGRA